MKLTDYKPNAARHIMLYGPPKVGKSVAAMLLAMYGYRLYYVDGEDSIKSAWSVDAKGDRIVPDSALENIELIRVPDNVNYPIMIETLLKIVKGGPVTICHGHGKVSCSKCAAAKAVTTTFNVDDFGPKDVLVIDSTSQLTNSALNHIKQREIQANKEDIKPDWDDYRKQGFLLDRIFSIIQNAPWNCIAISHEVLVEMEDGKKKIVPLVGTTNFSKTSAKYFDDVVYFDKVNLKLKQYSSATFSNSVTTGSRSGKLIEKEGSRGLVELFE